MSAFPVPVASLHGVLYLSAVMCTAFYGVVCMQTKVAFPVLFCWLIPPPFAATRTIRFA
ncbi:hypothetical protein J3R83DRAFT_1489 [Lanmaoa asiatica]|nr:hypothetical protein J3R83DRAFT_1489 [Lanmaoa asiatica]